MNSQKTTTRILLLLITLSLAPRAEADAPLLDLGSLERRADIGALAPAAVGDGGGLDRGGRRPAFIGSLDGRDEFFSGDIDDVRLHEVALDAAGIAALAAGDEVGDGLVARWPLDGDLSNASRRGPRRDGEAIGGAPSFVEGRLGRALRLDGRGRAVRIEHHEDLKPGRAITIAAWIRPDATPDSWMEIYRKEDGGARQLLAIGRTGFYGLWCGLGIDGSYVERGAAIDRAAIRDGRWHHVAATFDGEAIALYLDGREIGRHAPSRSQPEEIELVPPDERLRVAFLGDTFIERMAHSGSLEAELTRFWPDRDIVFRNLGWPGDTVEGIARTGFGPGEYSRSAWQRPGQDLGNYGFDRMLAHLRRARPDVVFIGYGSNVAFEDDEGAERFARALDRLLDVLDSARMRIVLMTPPPREPRGEGWPDMSSQNERLEWVAAHLANVAARRGHILVDMFRAFARWPQEAGLFTHNGIHLNEEGYRFVASTVAESLRMAEPEWALHLRGDGSVASASGTAVEAARRTEFGLRFRVRDVRLPSLAAPAGADRLLRIEGLPPGSYSLDIAGRRVARAGAAAWAEGVVITHGPDVERARRLRETIVEKNRLFAHGFRPQNTAYVYLFRRHERGHHEGEIAQFDVLVGEKEEEIARLRRPTPRFWELVRETDYPDHEVPFNVPEPDIEKELERFTVAEGFEVGLFASDPMIANPINLNWDERGRAWLATSTIYPHLAPGQKPDDRILILEDVDRDGRADTSRVFADGLLVPHSVVPGHGGVFVTQSTDLLFLRDVDGDDRADERRVLFTGFGNADVHHMIHALRWGPGGDLYFTQSIYINSFVETPWGRRRLNGSGIWRLRPEVMRLEVHARGLVNPWGHAFDRWGQSFSTDGAGGGGIAYSFPGSAFRSATGVARTLETLNPGRPKECGLEVVSGRHLPESWRGSLITSDFRANRVVRYELTADGSGYSSRLMGEVLASSHRSFRPVDVKLGPDGAIYVVDWYSPIIDHGEVDFHHPLRDRHHGRIWRLTASDRAPVEPPRLHDAPTADLLAALELPEGWTRDQARRLLRQRGPDDVVRALRRWLSEIDAREPAEGLPGDDGIEHHRLEALWVFQGLRVAEPKLLRAVLRSPDHRARAAAVRVLGDWRDEVPDATALLAAAIADEHPQVRLEAVNALREAPSLESVELAMAAIDRPLDTWLDYALWLTARELERFWLPDFEAGKPVFDGKPRRVAFALSAVGKPASLAPLVTLVRRGELAGDERRAALELIAGLGGPEELALVVAEATGESGRADRAALLAALADGARRGRPAPANASRIAALVESLRDAASDTGSGAGASDARALELAVELAGLWRVARARPELERLAASASTGDALRLIAATAIGDFADGLATLRGLAQSDPSSAVRRTATAAWVAIDQSAATPAAIALLSGETADEESASLLVEAYLGREGGDAVLAAALAETRLDPGVAAAGIRAASSTGREVDALVEALRRAGELDPITTMPPPDELTALIRAVATRGSAARGEAIYRRESLQCATCHAIGGEGGLVGPDLSGLGGSAQVVHIIESLLDPSAKIKQGYETVVVIDARGAVHSGVLARRTDDEIVLRDMKDRLVTIPARRIRAVTGSPASLMPIGLTQTLRQDELIDLTRFLSELGVSRNSGSR